MTTTARRTWTPRRRRAALLLACGALLATGGHFVQQAFRANLVFYLTPAELAARAKLPPQALRIGGMVRPGSVQREGRDGALRFVLHDATHAVPVVYVGVLPDLFAEGQGAIAQGRLDADGTLQATEVLAKHDENYRPPGLDAVPHPDKRAAAPGLLRPQP